MFNDCKQSDRIPDGKHSGIIGEIRIHNFIACSNLVVESIAAGHWQITLSFIALITNIEADIKIP